MGYKNGRFNRSESGFSLIEVLIGIAISGVGILSVVQLQKLYIQSSTQINARVVALKLATEKIANTKLKTFSNIIASANGQRDQVIHKTLTFNRHWTISNRYYIDGVWQTGAKGLNPATAIPDEKIINITVKWHDLKGQSQVVRLAKYISKQGRMKDVPLHNLTSHSDSQPKVNYHRFLGLDNLPIPLFDADNSSTNNLKRISSKPLRQTNLSNNLHRVEFSTLVFGSEDNTHIREDFATVNCHCSFGPDGNARTPITLKLDNNRLIIDPKSGQSVAKERGEDSESGLETLCSMCCTNHHDDTIARARYQPLGTDNHYHYRAGKVPPVASGAYLEACRFKRVNGFYQLVPDWLLIDLIIIPQSFFSSTKNTTAYTRYLKRLIKAYLLGNNINTVTKPNRISNSIPSGTSQLIARGIYIDLASLSSSDIALIKGQIGSNNEWLALIPFYDIDLTLLAKWHSSDIEVASITNQPIDAFANRHQYYDSGYSRGRLVAVMEGTTQITAAINANNTGLTNGVAITPSNTVKSDSIKLTVAVDITSY